MNGSLLVALVIYRAVIAAIGFGFAYLGFRLLTSKPAQQQGEAQQTPRAFLTTLKEFGPGCWFALFGGAIVAICLLRGLWIDLDKPLITASDGPAMLTANGSQAPATSALLGVGMLVVTTVLVILTAWYAWSNHRYTKLLQKQLQLQTDPHVIAFTQPNPERGWGIDIVIKNFGRGIAKDVSFECSDKVDEQTWHDFLNAGPTSTPLMQTQLQTGIPVLPPRGTVVIPWDQAGGFALRPGLRIVCKCKRLEQGPESEVGPIECFLDPLPDPIRTEE